MKWKYFSLSRNLLELVLYFLHSFVSRSKWTAGSVTALTSQTERRREEKRGEERRGEERKVRIKCDAQADAGGINSRKKGLMNHFVQAQSICQEWKCESMATTKATVKRKRRRK